MIEQALSEIKSCEDQAKEAVRAAQEAAQASRGEVDLATADKVRQAKEQGKAYMAGVMEQATLKADNQYRDIVAEATKAADLLASRLEPSLDGLANELVEEIIHGDC